MLEVSFLCQKRFGEKAKVRRRHDEATSGLLPIVFFLKSLDRFLLVKLIGLSQGLFFLEGYKIKEPDERL